MIGQGVSSFSSHSCAAGRTTSSAKPWTQSRMSFWSWLSCIENAASCPAALLIAKRPLAFPAATAAAALALAACGSSSSSSKHIAVVAYSTPQSVFEKLIPAFQATSQGKGTSFSQSYGPSGEQARAVVNGLNADLVDFSLEPDVEKLIKAGPGSTDWNKTSPPGFVSNSV